MAYPTSNPLPIAVGATDNVIAGNIPVIFSDILNDYLYQRLVASNIANRKYEGKIKEQGSEVRIPQLPSITVNTHYTGQTLDYEFPVSTPISLLIDHANWWGFLVTDPDKIQSNLDLGGLWSQHSMKMLEEAVDRTVLQSIPSDAGTLNQGTTAGADGAYNLGSISAPVALTSSNALAQLLMMDTLLDEANAPDDERWCVIPPWFHLLLMQTDIVKTYITGDSISPLRGKWIGKIGRMNLHVSNQLLTATATDTGTHTATYMPFGWKGALTFAAQAQFTDSFKHPDIFGQVYRGLEIYGWKTTNPEALGTVVAYYGA